MKISNNKVIFKVTLPSGRMSSHYIEAIKSSKKYDEPASVNIPAMGDIQLKDLPELIKAIELAAMIASGELEIE